MGYKMNCVNDSHMIVSGLPPAENDQHCVQIANLALKIFNNANRFVVSHRPYEGLKLRAGFHTGDVIAGVQCVGIKMPRYRLFGYILEPRGLIMVDGHDQRETFWLTGREDGSFAPDGCYDISEGPDYLRRMPSYFNMDN